MHINHLEPSKPSINVNSSHLSSLLAAFIRNCFTFKKKSMYLCWILVAAHGLLFSCGMWALGHMGSVVAAHGLSCPMACGILVPQPGIKPMSPALEGRFLTTELPRKYQLLLLWYFHARRCQ